MSINQHGSPSDNSKVGSERAGQAQGRNGTGVRSLAQLRERLPRMPLFIAVWLILTALAVPFDYPVAKWMSSDFARGTVRPVLGAMSFMGLYPVHLLAIFALLALPKPKKILIGYLTATLGPMLLCGALKFIIGRARPKLYMGPFHFEFFHGYLTKMNSFPSGEATSAMALATVLGFYFPRSRWAFWILGGLTGLARVAKTMHFLSDAVFAAGLGIGCVFLAASLLGPQYFKIEKPQLD